MNGPPDKLRAMRAQPDLTIHAEDYARLCGLAYELVGVVLGSGKQEMLQARLGKRVRDLRLKSIAEYVQLLRSQPGGPEVAQFVGAVTTHKTDFFREAHHFDFLARRFAPDVLQRVKRGLGRNVRIWSAACSSGEEPYTIAMTLRDAFGDAASGIDLKILASDVDVDVLERARKGVYTQEQVRPIPLESRKRHLQEAGSGLLQVRAELQSLIVFRAINFRDDYWPIKSKLDVIFCRNALIYFDASMRRRLIMRFHGLLKENGHLIIGHSESLSDVGDAFERVGQTIYRKHSPPGQKPATSSTPTAIRQPGISTR